MDMPNPSYPIVDPCPLCGAGPCECGWHDRIMDVMQRAEKAEAENKELRREIVKQNVYGVEDLKAEVERLNKTTPKPPVSNDGDHYIRESGVWYRRLQKDEWIIASDLVLVDGPEWQATTCAGKQAPDPAFTSHRVYYRRLPEWMQESLNKA